MMWSSFAVSYGYSLKKKTPNHENKPETQKILAWELSELCLQFWVILPVWGYFHAYKNVF